MKGSIPTRGYETRTRPNFMTTRSVETKGIGINIPRSGEKPAFMSDSKSREGNSPLIKINSPRTDFMTDRGVTSRQTIEPTDGKSRTNVRGFMTRPVTEGARVGDKTFAQAVAERQVRSAAEPVGDRVRQPEGKTGQTEKPKKISIQRRGEVRPLIDIKKPITPVRRETHTFYTPAARSEMTGRVTLQPMVRESMNKPTADMPTNRREQKALKQGEIQKPQEVRGQVREIQILPAKKGLFVEQAPGQRPEMNKGEAIETLKSYAKTPKSERKLTPEIKQAFEKTIDEAKTPLTSAVIALWQEKEGQQVAPGVSPEATTYLKSIIEQNPDLKRNIDSQLGIATIVMANYVAVGYPIIEGTKAVLVTLEGTLRKTIRKTLETQTKPGFPENEILEEGDEDPESGDDRDAEEEAKTSIETITFMRAEEINAKRVKELLHLAELTAEEDEETGVKMVNPRVVAQIWELTAENISPIVKHPGMKQHIDGSWEEIVSDMQTWERMSMSEFRESIKSTITAKTAVDIGENPYATTDDVQRVLTVPAEYTTFRMNSLSQQVRPAA